MACLREPCLLCLLLKLKCLCLAHGLKSLMTVSSLIPCVGSLVCRMAQKLTFGGMESKITVTCLFIDVAGDIPFHTTCEMTVRKRK